MARIADRSRMAYMDTGLATISDVINDVVSSHFEMRPLGISDRFWRNMFIFPKYCQCCGNVLMQFCSCQIVVNYCTVSIFKREKRR